MSHAVINDWQLSEDGGKNVYLSGRLKNGEEITMLKIVRYEKFSRSLILENGMKCSLGSIDSTYDTNLKRLGLSQDNIIMYLEDNMENSGEKNGRFQKGDKVFHAASSAIFLEYSEEQGYGVILLDKSKAKLKLPLDDISRQPPKDTSSEIS